MKTLPTILLLVASTLVWTACSSTYDATNKSPEDIFAAGKKAYEEKDLFEAQRLFDIIRLQYPTAKIVDGAQYYLAEINYKRSEYVLGAYNYNYLRRMYPSSEYAQRSMYKAAMCYVELSPPYDRDQKYTREAIVALTEYRERYKGDSTRADSLIKTLRSKLGEHDFRVAEQYRVLLAPKASLTYYDSVIDDYSDTDFCEPSMLGKTEVLIQLKRYDEALSVCSLYSRFYPNGPNKVKMEQLRASIPLNPQAAATPQKSDKK